MFACCMFVPHCTYVCLSSRWFSTCHCTPRPMILIRVRFSLQLFREFVVPILYSNSPPVRRIHPSSCLRVFFFPLTIVQTMPEEWLGELDLCVMEANPLLRECFMYHRSTKTVFAMDSLVYLQPEHVSNAFLGTVLTMAGMYGRVSTLVGSRRALASSVFFVGV